MEHVHTLMPDVNKGENDVQVHADESSTGTVPCARPDPSTWPESINAACAADYVESGPYKHKMIHFPVGKNNRCLTAQHRTLSNKEESMLMCSDENDSVYFFACRLFSGIDALSAAAGFNDWKNLSATLKVTSVVKCILTVSLDGRS